MIFVYPREQKDFTYHGILLTDVYNDVITWKMNQQYTLSFDYLVTSANSEKLAVEKIVVAETPSGKEAFRISSIQKNMGVLTVHAYQLFWDLIQNFIRDTNIVNKNGPGAIQQIMNNLNYSSPFTVYSNISEVSTARIVRMNPVEALIGSDDNSLLNRWCGEFDWNQWNIEWLSQIGKDRGVEFRYGHNILGYSATTDLSGTVTRIMPEGYNGLLLPELYVDSPQLKKYATPRIMKIVYSDIQDTQQLREQAKKEFSKNKLDEIHVTYEVNVVLLENIEEYKNDFSFSRVYPGDTATFIHTEDNITAKARLVAYTWSPVKEEYLTVTFSSKGSVSN